MELKDYLRVLRKRWRLVVAVPLLALLAAAFVTAQATPLYQSSVTFFVSTPAATSDSSAAYTGGLFSQQRVKSYADLLSGAEVRSAVAADVGVPEREIEDRVTAQVQPDTVLLTATVTDSRPARAQALAAAVGRQFPELVQRLERPADGGPASIRATVVAEPELPRSPVSPRPLRNLALALVLGLLLGVGFAVLRETLDTTVHDAEDVREVTGLATLAVIGYDSAIVKRPLVVHDSPRAPRAEAFRQLRTNLQFVDVDTGLRSLVITSSVPGEAKSTTACNLAITLAQTGQRVLLIEGDLRRPRVAEYLGVEGAVGLTSVLIGDVSLPDAVQPWGEMTLDVLPSGPLPPNPAELLGSSGMRTLLTQCETDYDIVVVDAPPLLPVTDAAVLSTMTSGALLCVHVGSTRKEQVAVAIDSLRSVGATVFGSLLTLAPRRTEATGYGYGYGYDGYESDTAKPQLEPLAAAQAVQQRPPSTTSAVTQEPVREAEPVTSAVTTDSYVPSATSVPTDPPPAPAREPWRT